MISTFATALLSEAALRFLLLGTATGALTALVALGIVIVYRASGVLNFSAGALGGIAAYYCYDLRDGLTTTDYAPIAAQTAERDTDAVGLLPVQPVVMLNALAAEGITAEDRTLTTASVVMSPEVVEELGDTLDGLIVVSPTVPPTDTGNPGIAEVRDDLAAAGYDPDDPDIDFNTVVSWSKLKKLEEALGRLTPEEIASLDSQALVDAVVAHPVERPEAAHYDFRENALPELPDLVGFRIFTREVAILQLHHSRYDVLSDDFVDILEPPDLT